MPKLLLLWNVAPDREKEFEEALERVLSGLGSFPAVRNASFHAAMPPSRTFPSPSGTPHYGCMLEVNLRSASALPQLWSDPEYRRLMEDFMGTVADFTALGFQRVLTAREVITALPSTPYQGLVELLARHRISGVPVVDEDGRLVGIATEADVLARSGSTVGDIMTRQVLTVTEDTPIEDIAQVLTRHRIRRVPVVRGEQVVGIVSREDAIRVMASL